MEHTPSNASDLTNITVIGIAGRKWAGKDTAGSRLISDHGFVRIAFADALKEACMSIFGLSYDQVYGDLKEVEDEYWKYAPREILQKVGTELFRDAISQTNVLPKIGQDIWIRAVHRKILNLKQAGHTKFVITDVRFENELNFIRDLKTPECYAYSIKVVRPSIMPDIDTVSHSSEDMVDALKCDYEILNDGTIEDLHRMVDRFAKNDPTVTFNIGSIVAAAHLFPPLKYSS